MADPIEMKRQKSIAITETIALIPTVEQATGVRFEMPEISRRHHPDVFEVRFIESVNRFFKQLVAQEAHK